MSILRNNLKRLLRDKFNFIVMVILPVTFIALSIFAGNGNLPVRVGVVDNDGTFLTGHLMEGLGKNCMVVMLKEDEIKDKLLNSKVEYVIKIDKGFTDEIIAGEDARIEGYGIKDYNASIPAKLYINSFVSSAKAIAGVSGGGRDSFERGMGYYLEGNVAASYKDISSTSSKSGQELQSLGYMVMFMMYLSVNAASLITEDKKFKTYERILMSRLSLKRYALENVLSFFAVIWIQILALFAIMLLIFKMDFGASIISLVAFTLIYSVVSVSMGMAIVNLSKTLKQVSSVTPLIVIPMSMLGGCFWPKWIMPEVLQRASSFVPVSWALQGMEKILAGGSIASVGSEIGILLLFSLVFFLLGSAKTNSFA
ncbi:ABC transporter permease [Lutispora saccharofermentans]|uniref:ABC transporter permease n=1 Tax=Lutispora saccharofermentans TaxID=3024236 RepID=A0ABT1NFX4_9FIRM|nr:ABC transporter permease [Lutispora saccharofermentans]MCQ1530165.1 ABC transporter permease [Lutispora saccharofermentans]